MLKLEGKNMNFNATSSVDEEVIANMSATVNANEELYFHFSVTDYRKYIAHKEIVDSDFANFGTQIIASINNAE